MEGPPMTFVFHHGGMFKNSVEGDMIYEPDNTEVLMGVDGDTLDVFFVRGYYKELGYIEDGNCWWKAPGVPLSSGLRSLVTDADLVAMCKDCRRNQHVINIYLEHRISQPCIVDNMVEGVGNVEAESSKQQKSSQAKTTHSEPGKMATTSHRESKKQNHVPTKSFPQPSYQPNKPTMKSNFQPKIPAKRPNSQPSMKAHKPSQATTQPMKVPSQPMNPHSQPKKVTRQSSAVPPQPNTPSERANDSQGNSNKNKDGGSGCRQTRFGRHVKEVPIQEEDSNSHDSYESTEDELYRSPKVVGDDLYSSESDDETDNRNSGGRKDSKSEVREKHRPPKTRLADKEIETDDSSYEGSEDEQSSDSARPSKLQVIKAKARARSFPTLTASAPVAISAETINGTSSATAKKLTNFMTFVPNPGFKYPRRNDKPH
ncbi:hypothetical protein Ahy_B06g080705 [Arachis hypogaea]|uniref:PB1-like domain-containing protein n=1 Tax=Arachis hypogaea TaxID=3818 RepID=A0A444YIX2_ARAHY|nr:hypothetical protein Ahy_B06g080705 [Arachis hypogaea]